MAKIITVEKWRTIRLSFTSLQTVDNPFLDLQIYGVFTGPSGQAIRREAYWDGENEYKIAFAPTEIGNWLCELEAPVDSGLNGLATLIECVPYTGNLDIYKHGFLKVSDNHHYLTYNDGKPFFWLGDTHWEFAYREKWEESNHPAMTSMFCGMVDRRVSQGYTVYQTNLRSDKAMHGDEKYWVIQDGKLLPNVEFYQNELDRRMEYLAEHGIVNALGQAWFLSVDEGIEEQKQLIRYIIARYGSYPMVWTLAGEVAGYDAPLREQRINDWREVALYIQEIDSYGQLQTAHYTNERPFAEYYQDESWMDFTLNQAGHGDYLITVNDYQSFLNQHHDKPFIEGEALYEFCSTLEEMGTRVCTADMLRRVAYTSMQLGGCGYTYGAQGIWDCVWEKGPLTPMQKMFNRFGYTWYEAIDGIGGLQMGYMKQFYERVHFWELTPVQQEGDNNLFGNKAPLATINNDRNHIVMYYADGSRKKTTIPDVENGTYKVIWFHPDTNIYVYAEDIEVQDQTLVSLDKPFDGDALLEIMKA